MESQSRGLLLLLWLVPVAFGQQSTTIMAHLMRDGHEKSQGSFEWDRHAGSSDLLAKARTVLDAPVIRIFIGQGNEVAVRDVRGDEVLRAVCGSQRVIHLFFTTGEAVTAPALSTLGQEEHRKQLQAATELQASGDHAAALAVLQAVVKRKRTVEALLLLVQSQEQLGQWNEAKDVWLELAAQSSLSEESRVQAFQRYQRVAARITAVQDSSIDKEFLQTTSPMLSVGYGTEWMSRLLHSVARFTRIRWAAEIGVGYTTPFLLRALKDNLEVSAADWTELQRAEDMKAGVNEMWHSQLDHPAINRQLPFWDSKFAPGLFAIDDMSHQNQDFRRNLELIEDLGLRDLLHLVPRNFVGASSEIRSRLPAGERLDMIWFDAKGTEGTLADFLVEYWSLLRADGGLLLVHFTSGWQGRDTPWRIDVHKLVLELKLAKPDHLERISLVEPHKFRQGAVTVLRRVEGQVAPQLSTHPTLRRTVGVDSKPEL